MTIEKTLEKLKQYQALKKEIAMLEQKIDRLERREIPVVSGKVIGSSHDFPYTQVRTTVEMNEPIANDTLIKSIRTRKKRIKEVEQSMLETEDYISRISDSTTRQIFELTFLEGLKQREVAERVSLERSSISKKIKGYLQLSHNSQK